MTIFRPCIDLHNGKVKQIVGGTLDNNEQNLCTNFESEYPASYYASLYAKDKLQGGHIIKLGDGNDAAALTALDAYPNALQIGGGINADNACYWLDKGASHIIVTSWLFPDGKFSASRLESLVKKVGKDKIVLDLSCRKLNDGWVIAMNRWQSLTDMYISIEVLNSLSDYCAEFLIHAADVEGLCGGIDESLVSLLGAWGKIPITYAGGAKSIDDLSLVSQISNNNVDLTIGSALDIFGGNKITYAQCVKFNRLGN